MIDKVKELLYFKEKLNIMNGTFFVLKERLRGEASNIMSFLSLEMSDLGVNLEKEYVISISDEDFRIDFFISSFGLMNPHSINLNFLKEGEVEVGNPCVSITIRWNLGRRVHKIEISERTFFSKNFMNAFANVFSDTKASKSATVKKFKDLEKTA